MFLRGRLEGVRGVRAKIAFALAAAFIVSATNVVCAQQQDSVLKQAFKIFGFATDVGPPADFVAKTRPPSDPDYIPVFQPPPEPALPALKNDELKAVKTDLDAAGKHHDTLRQAFPPAAKALAEQQAAQKKPKSNTPSSQQ